MSTKEKAYLFLGFSLILAAAGYTWYDVLKSHDKWESNISNAEDYLAENNCTDVNGNSYKDHCDYDSNSCYEVTYQNHHQILEECIEACRDACENHDTFYIFILTFCTALFGASAGIYYLFITRCLTNDRVINNRGTNDRVINNIAENPVTLFSSEADGDTTNPLKTAMLPEGTQDSSIGGAPEMT